MVVVLELGVCGITEELPGSKVDAEVPTVATLSVDAMLATDVASSGVIDCDLMTWKDPNKSCKIQEIQDYKYFNCAQEKQKKSY